MDRRKAARVGRQCFRVNTSLPRKVCVELVRGVSPIPYKLVTIVSGALAYPLHWFVLASIVTRGARFLLVAWIFQRFGPPSLR